MYPTLVAADLSLIVLLRNWLEALDYQALKIQTSG